MQGSAINSFSISASATASSAYQHQPQHRLDRNIFAEAQLLRLGMHKLGKWLGNISELAR
jgi:hypothetical protein